MLVIEVINGDAPAALVPTNLVAQTTLAGSDVVYSDMTDRASETIMRRLFNALNFARTGSDQLRVVVDTGTVALGQGGNAVGYVAAQYGQQGAYPPYYGLGSPWSVDERENTRMAFRENFNDVRRARWSLT